MPINRNELTKEMLEKAMQCKTADELTALAKQPLKSSKYADLRGFFIVFHNVEKHPKIYINLVQNQSQLLKKTMIKTTASTGFAKTLLLV